MRSAQRSALVPYSAEQMFRLVDDVPSYPQFLPWCSDARVEREEGDVMEATLVLKKGGLSRAFTTRNRRVPSERIDLSLVGGPFRHLEGSWHFADLDGKGCKVELAIDFEFESKVVDVVFGSFFEETCNSLVDAFTRRAADVYAGGHDHSGN